LKEIKKVFPKEVNKRNGWSLIELRFIFFSLVALADTASITLNSYKENSLQGDSALLKSIANGSGLDLKNK
jgi:3-phosphoshikimate 1-carboxyvinyltransferase